MPATLQYIVQSQLKTPSFNETGDYNGCTTTVPFGATRATTLEVKPDTIRELIIDTDIACTVDFGDADPITLAAGAFYEWHLSSGVPRYFTGSSAIPFTIVSTEGSASGEVRIAFKTPEPA
jgi:hypothetical protein